MKQLSLFEDDFKDIFITTYVNETISVLKHLLYTQNQNIKNIINTLFTTRTCNGRLFILGVGGSSATASHAVNDFRKICKIEAYCPTDNVSELTAITNDLGWENSFVTWLQESKLTSNDTLLICSVGGGNKENNISTNIIKAIDFAKSLNCNILGIVGRDGGYTKLNSNYCVVIPTITSENITPNVEGLTGVLLHLIVSHPDLKVNQTKWESVKSITI